MKPAPLLALMALLAVATARAEPDADPADAGLADAAANEGDSGSVVDASPPIHEIVDDAIRALSRKRNAAGLWYTQRGRYPEALNAFREAHDLDRTDPEITENLGYLHQLLGNRFDAIRYYRETLRLSSRRRTALKNLAEVLAADGASAEALAEADDLLTRARRVKDNDPEIIRRQARIAARRGRYDDARKLYDEALTLDPADDALALELGDFHRDFGHPNEALIWYRRVREPEEALREAARR
ncbi:MAG: tetratricopeptide repeat protein, partial [Myxococcales bacterium]|nr:tetratricopeptide repeat protein [Myxococcales bacterium]